MPLLNGKPLAQSSYQIKNLPDDEEVFYCEITNEIFKDYQEYCERVISCSCMIWSCAITGKSELTYQEALESEERALKNIKDLPPELRTPVLYLASLTHRKHFANMADDVYNFLNERYCLGEGIEVCFEDNVWEYAQVTRILMPSAEEVMAYCEEKNIEHPIHHKPYPADLYKYEVEEICEEEEDDDCLEIRVATVECCKIRRTKGVFTRDKNRQYLKQFTELNKNSIWVVKSAIMAKYGITNIEFQDFFTGEPPVMYLQNNLSLSMTKLPAKSGKLKQQSMKNFLISGGGGESDKKSFEKKKSSDKDAIKIQKKYAATIEKVAKEGQRERERMEKMELLRQEKEAKRQEREKLADFAREWQRKREDLECEDLKQLPLACPVDCRIPNDLFGDFIMILEFLSTFRDVLRVKDHFGSGLSFELLERALMDIELEGPFSDLLQMLLCAVFEFQDQEDDEVKTQFSGDIDLAEPPELSTRDAVKLATQAARWSRTHHNVPLNELHMDAITVTDILRLHLLSSGGRAGELSFKWRFQERGGYTSSDDPGLEFRINEPHILKFLAFNCVSALPVEDKLKVLSCLMNQILTYASVRDILDERYDEIAVGRKALKIDQLADSKKEREMIKEMNKNKSNGGPTEDLEKVHQNSERKKLEFHRRWLKLQDAIMKFHVMPLGEDRGHRRFWIFTSLPGLFVEDNERWPGFCLPCPTVVNRAPTAADEDDTMSYIRKLFEEARSGTGSDKENDGDGNTPAATPKKKLFGEINGVCVNERSPSPPHASPVKPEENKALVCTADIVTCTVHNPSLPRTRWLFYHRAEDVEDLIKTLNKRGYREHALREVLSSEKERVLSHIDQCPVQKLNRFVPFVHAPVSNKIVGTRSKRNYGSMNVADGISPEVAIQTYVREMILDTEDKIHCGGLGKLKVKDRQFWRQAIENHGFDAQDQDLTWPKKMLSQKVQVEEDDGPSRPGSSLSMHSNNSSDIMDVPEQSDTVRDLATAVLQIGRSLEPKYRKKPLLFEEKRPIKLSAVDRWELSLMRSTSFSQVHLHLTTLDSSIQWNRSLLNARCKVCRRGKDDENMLLCDQCDRGFHLYCLKPKLKAIPRGDWFCPACRPKEKTPVQRNRRRRFFDEEEENISDDEPVTKRNYKRKKCDFSFEEIKPKRGRK